MAAARARVAWRRRGAAHLAVPRLAALTRHTTALSGLTDRRGSDLSVGSDDLGTSLTPLGSGAIAGTSAPLFLLPTRSTKAERAATSAVAEGQWSPPSITAPSRRKRTSGRKDTRTGSQAVVHRKIELEQDHTSAPVLSLNHEQKNTGTERRKVPPSLRSTLRCLSGCGRSQVRVALAERLRGGARKKGRIDIKKHSKKIEKEDR